jgi:DNA-binding LytR/AlgR family response regulator
VTEAGLLKALVLEDEWPARNYLVELIEGTQLAEVVGAVASVDEARQAISGSVVDVVFVDIELTAASDGQSGLDLVRSLAKEPGAPMFVLATASPEHGPEAFELGVVDYILKPFTDERVEACLRRLLARRSARSRSPRRVVARRKKSLVFLDPETIWAFEASDRLTFVHALEGKFDVDLSLAAIEASFGRTLFRVHRNWLVNLNCVKELEREMGGATVTVGTDSGSGGRSMQVPVSQDRSKALRDALLENATGVRRT